MLYNTTTYRNSHHSSKQPPTTPPQQEKKRRDMSHSDLVSAQTSNVCETHHAALNAIYSIHCMCQTICDVTSSKIVFSMSRKGGTGGGGLVYTPKW